MFLRDKNIFLISPQDWGSNPISKHHYTTELIKRNNKIFYINPPLCKVGTFSVNLKKHSERFIEVSICLPLFHWVKFKIVSLYNYWLNKAFSKLIKTTSPPDILWNFDNETFFNQEYLFNSSFKIFHPVDDFENKFNKQYDKLYDIVFSVSQEILVKTNHPKRYFINHGLSPEFISYIKENKILPKNGQKPIITYMGNLSIPFLDREVLEKTITSHPQARFKFVGSKVENDDFWNKIRLFNNVEFTGRQKGKELFQHLYSSDILLICYKKQDRYFGDNTHKLLEYLATGNTIVSTHLSIYKNNNLIQMLDSYDNSKLPGLVKESLHNIDVLNNSENRKKRIAFAKANSYKNQIDKIATILDKFN